MQEYSILAIFTNGNVHDKEVTIKAIEEVIDDPLSIVVIGVGPSDFNDMTFLNEADNNKKRKPTRSSLRVSPMTTVVAAALMMMMLRTTTTILVL